MLSIEEIEWVKSHDVMGYRSEISKFNLMLIYRKVFYYSAMFQDIMG